MNNDTHEQKKQFNTKSVIIDLFSQFVITIKVVQLNWLATIVSEILYFLIEIIF